MSVSIADGVTALDVLNPEDAARVAQAAGSSRMIASSAVAITSPTDTAENTLVTIVIPAGSMGPNGIVVVKLWSSMTGTANKVFRVKFGGTLLGTCTLSTSPLMQSEFAFQNRGSESSQIGQNNSAQTYREFASGSFLTGAINSAIDQNLTITMQKVTGAESMVLERYSVEIIRPLA